mgnify:CR=1 FL=1
MDLMKDKAWSDALRNEFTQPYFVNLMGFVDEEYKLNPSKVFPPKEQIFNAFDKCPYNKVRVVILGQDPYPTRGHANGMSFSLNPDVFPYAKSLVNIFKEVMSDTQCEGPENGDLTRWAEQGVLLLNDVLTVREGEAGSHQKKGWEQFTQAVIQLLNDEKKNVVFILWGGHAHKKEKWINGERHHILKSGHPSPLSANQGKWFGNKHFTKTNDFLKSKGLEPISW